MKFHLILPVAAAFLAFAGYAAERQSVLLDGIAAEVGGERITIADVMADAREMAYAQGRVDVASNPAVLRELYAGALSNLVSRKLVLLQYGQGDAKIPDWYFNQRIERIVESSFGGDKTKLVAMLESRGMNYGEWRRRRIDDMIFGMMRQQFIAENVKVRPSEVAAVFAEKYAGEKLPGHVKVSMIMFNAEGKTGEVVATARAEVEKLRRGQDFAATAKRLSVEKHAAEGGSWGYIEPEDELREELAAALKPLGIGAVSDPVVVGDYVYVLRKDDERADLSVPLEAVREKIEGELLEERGEARFAAWIKYLAEKNTVRIFPLQ